MRSNLQGGGTMFKSVKKTAGIGKAKADFKLEFHATRVPQRGWDRLLVSLIPLETGKITVKSGKALVRNGSCQWTDPVYESARVAFDPKAKEGIYKIVVSTGSSRFGVLGETTINFAEHIEASIPTSVTLPLQNCNAGTILHVKLQCLTPKALSRDLEDQREASPDQDLQSAEPNEHAKIDPQFSGNQDQGSEMRFSFLESEKNDISLSPVLRYSSESLEIPSTPSGSETNESGTGFPSGDLLSPSDSVSSFTGKQESRGGLTDYSGFRRTGSSLDSSSTISSTGVYSNPPKSGVCNLSSPTHPLKYSHDPNARQMEQLSCTEISNWSSQGNMPPGKLPLTPESAMLRPHTAMHRRNNSLTADLEVAESTIKDLQKEAVTWEQNAWKLGAEIDILKQQLIAETKRATEMEMELSSLAAERDTIKLEVELLKSKKQINQEKDSGEDKVWLRVTDARNTVMELQDELAYEKSVNCNLTLQLQKTQESNSELLLEIQDLEHSLQKKNMEVEELNLKTLFKDDKRHKETTEDAKTSWMQKSQTSEAKIQNLGDKFPFLQTSEVKELVAPDEEDQMKIVELLRKELVELERDSQELTEENMDLMSKLNQANTKLDGKDQLIVQLESEIKMLSEHSTAEVDLKSMVNDLKEKLRFTEESSQSQLASTRTLLDDLNSSAMVLRSKNAYLEIQLKSAEEKNSSLRDEHNIMKMEIESHEKERALIASQKGQLKLLRERAAKAEKENSNALKRAEYLEGLNETLKVEMGQVVTTLEQELKISKEKASLAHERYGNALDIKTDLQAEKDKMGEQISNLLVATEKYEDTLNDLKTLNAGLQERLQQAESDCAKAFHHIHERETNIGNLLEQLATNEAEVRDLKDKLLQLEVIKEDLEKNVEDKGEKLKVSRSHMKDLEFQVSALKEDLQSSNESRSTFIIKAQELQVQNNELRDKLLMAEEHRRVANDQNDTLVEELRVAKIEMESLVGVQRSMENELSDLENGKELLQIQIKKLEVENLHLQGMINELDTQCKDLLKEKDSFSGSIINLETRNNEVEISLKTVIKNQELEIHELQNELANAVKEGENNRETIQDLHMCTKSMKKELAAKTISYAELEDQLQKLAEEYSASSVKIGLLEHQLAVLERESEEKNKKLLGEIEALLLTKKDLEERARKAEEMLRSSHWEKTYAHLQQDIHRLTHDSSNSDNKEHLATDALLEVSQFRKEKGLLEDKLWNMQNMVRQANADSLSAKEAKKHQIEIGKRLEETLEELDHIRKEETRYQQKAAELEQTCIVLEEEICKLAVERDELRCKIQDSHSLQIELRDCRDSLHDMTLEKIKVETSLQKISLDNSKLKEELSALKDNRALPSEDSLGRMKQFRATVEQKNELMRLRRQAGELKRKLSEQMEGREELKNKVSSLEEELQRKAGALSAAEKKLKEREKEESIKVPNGSSPVSLIARSLSRSSSRVGPMSNISPSRDAKELADLREKVKLLEDEIKTKSLQLEKSKQLFKENETELHNKVEHLELVNEQLVGKPSNSNIDQLQKELTRLQDENAALFQRENELLCRLGSQQALQNELEMLKEEKERLRDVVSKFNKASDGGNIFKRVVTLETELTEALEANNMYKSQLQSAFAKQHNVHAAALENLGSVDQVVKDLAVLKRKNSILEEELREMRERYFRMSLQFAEVEGEREELVMMNRSLRGGRRLTNCKSY